MRAHYQDMVQAADRATESLLRDMIRKEGHPHHGGFLNREDLMVHPGQSAGAMLVFSSCYCCPDSAYYLDQALREAMGFALDHCFRMQRPDGTFDLLISNFNSSPDTGFMMHSLARAWRILDRYTIRPEDRILQDRLASLIGKAADGMCNGGFHTPNHRWVIAAGLLLAYGILGKPEWKNMALLYLGEGIDVDENGEFTEKSTGVYNYVNDNALMIIGEELEEELYFDLARKNLDLTLCYLEPDGSLFTQNSVRVDKGEGDTSRRFLPHHYYHLYLLSAFLRDDPVHRGFADLLHRDKPQNALWLYLLKPGLREFEGEIMPIPEEFERFFPASRIVRNRRGDLSVTLLAGGSPNFLFVQKGSLRCHMRLCSSFFAVGQFCPGTIEKTSEGYRMSFAASGSYRLPFDTPPNTSVWSEMDHTKRRTVNHLNLIFAVDFTFTEHGVCFRVQVSGCDRVPLKLECCFTGNCVMTGEKFTMKATPGEWVIPGKGHVTAEMEGHRIRVGPAFASHRYAAGMRGSVLPSRQDYTVYFTEFTPVDTMVWIETE